MKDFHILLSEISHVKAMILLIVFLSILLFILNKRKYTFLILFSSVLGMSATFLLKIFFKIPRPENILVLENNFRFPSGHATMSAILSSLLYIYFKEKINPNLTPILFFICFFWFWIISYSRLFLNAHYTIDIIVGGFIGLFSVLFVNKVLGKYYK
jgi:membrane-associated phospholipid phosphatase